MTLDLDRTGLSTEMKPETITLSGVTTASGVTACKDYHRVCRPDPVWYNPNRETCNWEETPCPPVKFVYRVKNFSGRRVVDENGVVWVSDTGYDDTHGWADSKAIVVLYNGETEVKRYEVDAAEPKGFFAPPEHA